MKKYFSLQIWFQNQRRRSPPMAVYEALADTEFRYRTRFTKEQIRRLEEKFMQRPYIHKTQRLKLAEELKIPDVSLYT